MSDKEPRRRKKRKDGQKKEDLNFEEPLSTPQKSHDNWQKDFDQEAEEEEVVIHHEPSATAKIIFFILFSLLIVAVGTVFLALSGADRGPADVFDAGHNIHLYAEGPELIVEPTEEPSPLESSEESIDVLESWKEKLEELGETTEELDDVEPTIQESKIWPDYSLEEPVNYEEENHEDEFEDVVRDASSLASEEVYGTETESPLYLDDEPLLVDTYSEDKLFEEHSQFQPLQEEEEEERNTETKLHEDNEAKISPPSEDITSSVVPQEDVLKEAHKLPSEEIESNAQADWSHEAHETILCEGCTENTVESLESQQEQVVLPTVPSYEKSDITNKDDFHVKETLDEIDRILDRSPEKALQKYESFLQQHPNSPRAQYGKAAALDKLAEERRNNKLLEQAIENYEALLELKNVPGKLFLLAGKRAVDRMRFRGFHSRAIQLQTLLTEKFPEDAEVKNQLAVSYLLIGQNKEAKRILKEVLQIHPDNGFAKVHLGFILKTDDNNYPDAIKYMTEGIESREPGVIDGRFFFHLGDALARSGHQKEAMNIYENGVTEGVFLSAYQRSLYNVKGLTGQPWWEPEKTPFYDSLMLLENNWKVIRNESLALLNDKKSGFTPESEGLQDTGEWKQFELYARGRKVAKNCERTPYTCNLLENFPEAVGCKRGQIKFSIMQPGTHVWAHTGPTNCRLRAHLGLVIPVGANIRVANVTRQWKEGKIILFDDSFEHEVWHNGNSFRLVLIIDFWHPELTPYQKATLSPI